MVFTTTVTGLAVPTVEARLANRIGLRPDVKRVPLFGLGCVYSGWAVSPVPPGWHVCTITCLPSRVTSRRCLRLNCGR